MTELRRAWGCWRTSMRSRDWEEIGIWLSEVLAYVGLVAFVAVMVLG